MKIRALKEFEGIRDAERDVFPKEGDIWEVSEARANFLKEHGVVEIIDEVKELKKDLMNFDEIDIEKLTKKINKKKSGKK